MITPLAELFARPDIADTLPHLTRYGMATEVLDQAGPLGTIDTEAGLIEHLESLPDSDREDSRYRATLLLGCLPVSMLIDNFGEEIMAWKLANSSGIHIDFRMQLEAAGYDVDLLEKAAITARQDHHPPRGRDVLKQHRLAKAILGGVLEDIELPALVAQCPAPEVTLSKKRPFDYSLIPLRAEFGASRPGGWVLEWEGRDALREKGIRYKLGLDTMVGFALTHKGVPQAVVGVAAGEREGELQIRQSQAWWGATCNASGDFIKVKHPRELLPLDWQKLAVGIVGELARILAFDTVGIQSAQKIIESKDNDLSPEKARELYDDVAERLGFSPPDAAGQWHASVGHVQRLLAAA